MRKIIKLFLLAILTGCSPLNQVGIGNNSTIVKSEGKTDTNNHNKSEVNPSASIVSPVPTATSNSSVVSDSKTDNKLDNSLKNTEPDKSSPSPVPTVTPSVQEVKPDDYTSYNQPAGPNIDKPRFSDSDNIDRSYTINKDPVGDWVRNGEVFIWFKDEYKIRIKRFVEYEKHLINDYTYDKYAHDGLVQDFVSLTGENLDSINSIIKKYKPLHIYDSIGSSNTKKLDEEEIELEKDFKRDVPNFGSTYSIYVKDISVRDFVEELRASPLVKEARLALTPG